MSCCDWRLWIQNLCLGVSILLSFGCNGSKDERGTNRTSATIVIDEVSEIDYDHLELTLNRAGDRSNVISPTTFSKGVGSLSAKLSPGAYDVSVVYLLGTKVVFSSRNCPVEIRNERQVLRGGSNNIQIFLCDENGEILPSMRSLLPGSQATSGGFSVANGKIYDSSGKPFIFRGINMPHAYYHEESFGALAKAKRLGFNSVRIVWCADTWEEPGRCEKKDFQTAAELDRVLAELRRLKMVAVLNFQNATGSSTEASLQAIVRYMIRPDIKTVLDQYRDIMLINIANEWYGRSDNLSNWVKGYQNVIPKIRQAGLRHTLIVDAAGYAQNLESIDKYSGQIQVLDSNLVFSLHMYEVFAGADAVRKAFAAVRSKKIPFIIGEFACDHGESGAVDCDTIMQDAAQTDYPLGYVAWSYTGNNFPSLDLVSSQDWSTPSSYGRRILDSSYGVRATAKTACMFDATGC